MSYENSPTTQNSSNERRRATTASHNQVLTATQKDRIERAKRAERASYSVNRLFVHRLMGVPGTLIGEPSLPPAKGFTKRVTDWNYWWQAQLLDAFVDSGERAFHNGQKTEAKRVIDQCHRLLRGIRIHNFGTYVNSYYDDMAWLVLAAHRLNTLSREVLGAGSEPAQEVGRILYPQLRQAVTEDLGGGAFWSKTEDFKNLPASGPIAIALARAGDHKAAAQLIGWFRENLWSSDKGYLDGIKRVLQRDGSYERVVEEAAFPYNQGLAIGAHLEVSGGDVRHVEDIVRIVLDRFTATHEAENTQFRILDTRGTGDGGLFAGILARYLADAAEDARIDPKVRHAVREVIIATAELLWAGRREYDPDLPLNEPGVDVNEIRGDSVVLFSPDASRHSSETLGAGAKVELSSQIQAWTILEAAYRLA
ncbi:glycoside hydrolase family 76 protein [Rothia uropygioeca]|uniref:glycoside hydrolase family 76 protein n=1 Tax=Kocuria sp. 257 TaxID=2021970 RepID=UPI0010114EE8|nr:glycoside hydrolase family 76 protein [Kocuria sp. 257]